MNVKTISLGETTVSLRLTASKLHSYIKDYSNEEQSPLLSVLDAMESLKNKAGLFTAALQYKGNENSIKDGWELLDMLTDSGYSVLDVKRLIVELAEQSGLVEHDDAASVLDAIEKGNRKFIDTVAKVIAGENPEKDVPAADSEQSEEENPTEPQQNKSTS